MASVTKRVREIHQPRGGYLNPHSFQIIEGSDHRVLNNDENIHSSLVGLSVDYLTRFMSGVPVETAFSISLRGAQMADEEVYAQKLMQEIVGLDSHSIFCACQLVGYDVCFRAGPSKYKDVKKIEPDGNTITNIKVMVERSLSFLQTYGPIIKSGFTFEGGYTQIISSGDGDFLTSDTLWDFKVSTSFLSSAHTLQLLIYYIMGLRSVHNEFKCIKKLGIYNPRTNCIYIKNISDIPSNIIEEVSSTVIGYSADKLSPPPELSSINSPSELKDQICNVASLTMPEIMKALKCSRYMVMKYYSEKNLPLTKHNGKYYISQSNLIKWISNQQAEKNRNTIVGFILFLFFLILFIYFFSTLF